MDIDTMRFLRISAISFGLLNVGNVLAQEKSLATGQSKQQMRQQLKSSSEPEQDDFRSVLQARIRAMSQEEQSLMRDLSVNGRERMARENAATGEQMRDSAGYGRGFEARQVQSNKPAMGNPAFSTPGSSGAAMGAQGGGSRGGGGRGR